MGKRKKVILIVSIITVFLLGISLIVVICINKNKGLRLGMSYDKTIAFLEENGYDYEIWERSFGTLISINNTIQYHNINGNFNIHFTEDDKTICQINIITKVYSQQELNDKIYNLKKYLSKQYGKAKYRDDLSDYHDNNRTWYSWYKRNFAVSISYPTKFIEDIYESSPSTNMIDITWFLMEE